MIYKKNLHAVRWTAAAGFSFDFHFGLRRTGRRPITSTGRWRVTVVTRFFLFFVFTFTYNVRFFKFVLFFNFNPFFFGFRSRRRRRRTRFAILIFFLISGTFRRRRSRMFRRWFFVDGARRRSFFNFFFTSIAFFFFTSTFFRLYIYVKKNFKNLKNLKQVSISKYTLVFSLSLSLSLSLSFSDRRRLSSDFERDLFLLEVLLSFDLDRDFRFLSLKQIEKKLTNNFKNLIRKNKMTYLLRERGDVLR